MTVLEADGKTAVIVVCNDVPQGFIALRDEPRDDAANAIAQLRRLGTSSVMLTGVGAGADRAGAPALGGAASEQDHQLRAQELLMNPSGVSRDAAQTNGK
ncbi:hypothetical protein [Alloyangia pacifica]|uniref:hypothetical protein n=1 Tax=Roseobacteraceae TaxID=2854170 RepID=UPI0031D7BBEF